MAFGQRKFKVRVQRWDKGKKGSRVSLVSQRRITVAGRTVKAGVPVDFSKPAQLKQVISKPKKFVNPYGVQIAKNRKRKVANVKLNLKAGKINGG